MCSSDLKRLRGSRLGTVNFELLKAMCNFYVQPNLNAADVCVHGAAQVTHAGVVWRGKGVAEDQGWFVLKKVEL